MNVEYKNLIAGPPRQSAFAYAIGSSVKTNQIMGYIAIPDFSTTKVSEGGVSVDSCDGPGTQPIS